MMAPSTAEYIQARFGWQFPTWLGPDDYDPGVSDLVAVVADEARQAARARTNLRLLIRRTREDIDYVLRGLSNPEEGDLYEPLERQSLKHFTEAINERERRLGALVKALAAMLDEPHP